MVTEVDRCWRKKWGKHLFLNKHKFLEKLNSSTKHKFLEKLNSPEGDVQPCANLACGSVSQGWWYWAMMTLSWPQRSHMSLCAVSCPRGWKEPVTLRASDLSKVTVVMDDVPMVPLDPVADRSRRHSPADHEELKLPCCVRAASGSRGRPVGKERGMLVLQLERTEFFQQLPKLGRWPWASERNAVWPTPWWQPCGPLGRGPSWTVPGLLAQGNGEIQTPGHGDPLHSSGPPALGTPGHEGWPSAPCPSYLVRGLTGHGSQASHHHMTLFNTGVPGCLCQDEKHILQRFLLLEPQIPRDLGGGSKIHWFGSVQSDTLPITNPNLSL